MDQKVWNKLNKKTCFALFIFYYLKYILFKSIYQVLRVSEFFITCPKCSSSDGLQKGLNFMYSFLIWVGRLTSKLFFHIWKRIEVSRGQVCHIWWLRNQFKHDFMQFGLSQLWISIIRFWSAKFWTNITSLWPQLAFSNSLWWISTWSATDWFD